MTGTEPLSGEELVALAERLAKIAGTGGGAKALASHLSAQVGAAVLIEDAEWRHVVLAGAGTRSIPASCRELISGANSGETDALVLATPGDGATVLAVRIRGGDTALGWLSAYPPGRPREGTLAAMRLAAAAIGLELTREGGSRGRRRSFWDRLVARAYDDPLEAKDDAAARGIALASNYVAVALEAEGLDETVAAAKLVELRRIAVETLRSSNGDVAVLERGGGFVFLCAAPLEIDRANVRTAAALIARAAAKAHFGARVVGGVGRPAEALACFRTVEDAREAMFIARRLFKESRVIAYDELGVYPLLLRGGSSQADLRAFADRVLAPVRAYDEKHQTELIRTLRLYFEVGQNVKTAAAHLAIHRHTVLYRLRQIADISNHDLSSAHDQLTLRTAMAIDALNSQER